MKTKFKRIGKQSLSVILAVMMMVSTMLVGMVTSNAAGFSQQYLYIDLSEYTSDELNGINLFTTTSDLNNQWMNSYTAVEDRVYRFDVQSYVSSKGNIQKVLIVLSNGSIPINVDTYSSEYNCLKVDSSSNVTCTTYKGSTPTNTHNVTVTFSNATVTLDSDSLTSGIAKSVSDDSAHELKVTPKNGYSLTSVKIAGEEKGTDGTYTLPAGNNDVIVEVTTASTSTPEYEFYLTGYMGGDIGTNKGYKFTKESDGVYTYVITPNNDLYVTITDKNTSTTYMSNGYEELYVNKPSSKSVVTSDTSGADKWGIKGQKDKEIKITWDITGGISNGKIKWESTAQVVKPTATLTVGANEVYFGNSVTLTPGYTLNPNDATVTATTSYSVSPDSAIVTDNTFTVRKNLGESNTSIEYTVTYTVTLSNGESASASVKITAKDSAEQTAYKDLKSGFTNGTYPDPVTLKDKTPATVAAYKNAYENAQTAVSKGYPDAEGTTNNTDAKSALDAAQLALADKKSLPQPELAVEGGNTSVVAGSPIDLYISNESSYPDAANVTFEIYNADTSSKITTISKGQKANILNVAVGENKYYAKAVLGNTDDYSLTTAQSNTITVTGVEMVTVTVSAGTNGSAYIYQYTDVNGTQQTNTNITPNTVAVKKGTEVTFKAVPEIGFQVASWNDTSSEATEYKLTVSATTTVTVAFEESQGEESSDHFLLYAPGGNGKDTILQDATGATYQKDVVVRVSDGVYSVRLKESKYFQDDNWFAFTTNKTNPKDYIVGTKSSTPTVTNNSTDIISTARAEEYGGYYAIQVKFEDKSNVESLTISYKENAYTVSATEKPPLAAEPVPVTLNAVTVEGGKAYISSYTDNDTGSPVTNTPETTVTTVNAKAGTDVVFKAVAVANYYVKWQTSLDTTVATGNTFTLSNVSGTKPISVTATYVKIETYNVTVQAQVGGSVSATLGDVQKEVSNAIPVASNQVITLKAIPDLDKNYVFKGWDVNSTNYTLSSGTLTSKEIHVTPLGDVTFTAMFEVMKGDVDETYKLMYSSNDSTLTGDTNGNTVQTGLTFYKEGTKHKVKVPASILNKSGNNYLAFTTGTGATALEGMVARNGKKPGFAVEKSSDAYFSEPKINDRNEGNNKYYFIYFGIKSELESIIVEYDTNTNSYTLSAVPETPLENAVDVYVTNGNLVGIQYGSTKITSGITEKYFREDTTSSYIKYRAKKDDKVTVECTMDDAKAKLGYYVYAFVVNGNKVDAVQSGNGVYQTAIPVTITENTEITPVYYNTNIEKNGDYVTLYVNAPDELATEWGRSISIYSWYNVDGAEMDGAYPGQLMMRDTQGKYVAKISKYAYAVENGKFVRQNTQKIAGITINNYYENQGSVHQQFLSGVQKHNGQSYDYNDFVKIAEMGYDTVEFDVKYFKNEGTSDNPKSNQSALISNQTKLGTEPKNKTLSDELHVTPYKELTNIDGKPVSILGYDDATIRTLQGNAHQTVTGLDKSKKLHIISVGNQDNRDNDGTTKWATCWYVYDPDGKYITCGLPSDFIPSGSINPDGKFVPDQSQSKAYKDIVEKGLQYTSAEISYEVELDDKKSVEKNTGVRVDGRWYYARSADTVAVDLGIIYKTDKNDTVWTVDNATDESTITGKVTGATASFSYTDSIGNTHTNLASGSVERNTVLSINATNGTKYQFAGWAVPTYNADGTIKEYTQLNLTDFNATYTVGTATKLYAMYVPFTKGELTLTHSKYVGDGAHNGLGLFTIDAYHSDASGNPTNSSYVSPASVSDSVTLPIENKDDAYVTVVLTTQSYAKSRFLNFYYPKVDSGKTTLNKDLNIDQYYDKVCTATKKFTVKVSDLFVDGKQAIMALDYYSDLKLPEVASNITFNYNPYKEAPSPNPQPDMNGSGTTKFALTITKNSDNSVAYTTDSDVASLTLKGNTDLKAILEDYTTKSEDYTVTISLKAEAGSHCKPGETYRQTVNADGTYTYKNATSDTGGIWTYAEGKYTAKLSDLFDKEKQEFKSNTINFYTNFTAQSFSYDVTFNYIGYESRAYYDKYGYTQSPIISPESSWLKTYKATGTFYGAEIDTYVNTETNKFKEAFLLKVAPYEDNFVQTILWKLDKVNYTSQGSNSIVATVDAEYDNGKVTVQAVFPNAPLESYTVNYGSLVKEKNYIGTTPLPEGKEGYLIVAPDTYGDKTFSYWTIEKELANGDKIEVAKCYNREFNYIAYDNYIVTAHYGENVTVAKNEISATMTFLEYSRNQTASSDGNTDKVYADFAVSFDYYGKMLNPQKDAQNPNVICGVAFVVNKNVSSPSDATQPLVVSKDELLETIKGLNNSSSTNALSDGSKVYNYKINNKDLDNKNRIEYSWKVSNNENNNNLTILAYSYIYNTADETIKCISEPQSFKFYNVGHKTYENKQ